jgi:predicted PurR-regulated permease PerM
MKFNELDNSTKVILKVVLAILVFGFLWLIRDIILILVLALILASAMDPLVNYLYTHKIPRSVSVLAVYLLVVGLIVLFSYFFIPVVIDQFKIFFNNLPNIINSLQGKFSSVLGNVDLSQLFVQQLSGITGSNVVSSTFTIFDALIGFVSVLVISFYLVAEENGMKTFIGTLIPRIHHEFTITLVEKIQEKMGRWFLGQLIVILVMFVTTWMGLLILHVPYALILAVVAGLLEVVPYIGPFISAIPALLIALTQSPALALAVVVLYILLHELEGYVLVPKIMQKTVGTSPLAVLIALLVGFKIAGIVGLIISVPLVAAFTVTIHEFWPNKVS